MLTLDEMFEDADHARKLVDEHLLMKAALEKIANEQMWKSDLIGIARNTLEELNKVVE